MQQIISALAMSLFLASSVRAADFPTIAEKSEYQSTSTHTDVVSFCRELAKRTKRVTLDELGVSPEGKSLTLMIVADPPIAKPDEASKSGKMVVFVFANIHAGEVDGKEAILALVRDIALAEKPPFLKDVVLLIAPIFNADGNDRIAKTNRPEQNGPANGVGIRANAQGFDLNRDFIKLESPEVRSLVRLLNRWDPSIIIDMHTTNGSFHRYKLTYDGPRHPAADSRVIEYVRDRLLPDAGKRLKAKTTFDSFFYGNFADKHTKWDSYPAVPRFGIQYFALRNRIGLLSESYVYASYKDRIAAGRAFVEGCLEHVVENRDKIRALLKAADLPRDRVPLRFKTMALRDRFKVLGFVEEEKDGKIAPTKRTKDYEVEAILRCEPTVSVKRSWAYLVPANQRKAIETLRLHGIAIEELTDEVTLDVEAYRIKKFTKAEREFQKHRLVELDVDERSEKRKVPIGTFVILTEQRLGMLASYLLEPQSEDGLTAWNFFDATLTEGGDFPICRILNEVELKMK